MRDMEHRSSSLGEQVFERIEDDILAGRYERGSCTTELKLCAELGVSRTPVREALGRLAAEHLIKETSKGIVILGITREDLADSMEVRLALDGKAAARCASAITDEELRELREALELQEFYLEKDDGDSIKKMDSRFHELIYRFSGSTVYYEVLAPLHKKVQRFRRAALDETGRPERSVSEHRQIYEAIAARDPELAAERMITHANNARESLLASVKEDRGE